MTVMSGLGGIMKLAQDPSNYLPPRRCLDVKEVNGTVYKIDQCKNTIEVIARPAPPKKPQPEKPAPTTKKLETKKLEQAKPAVPVPVPAMQSRAPYP